MGRESPKWGREGFFPANPDLADILGDTDFDFENLYFFDLLDSDFSDCQVPDFQISRNLAWAGPGLGRAWAPLGGGFVGPGGPSGGPNENREGADIFPKFPEQSLR